MRGVVRGGGRGPAGNYQHGQDWGKGACLVWSGGAEGNLATSPQCSYRVGGVRLFLPISNSSQTKGSHNARFRSGIGKPSLPQGWCSTATGCPERSGNLRPVGLLRLSQIKLQTPDLLLAVAVLQGGLDERPPQVPSKRLFSYSAHSGKTASTLSEFSMISGSQFLVIFI